MTVFSAILSEVRDDAVLPIAVGLLLTMALVRAFAPQERRRLLGIVFCLLLQVALVPIAGVLRDRKSFVYADVRLACLILATLCVVGMVSILVFDILLPPLRCRAPRIVRDLTAAGATIVSVFVMASRLGFNVSGIIATSAVVTAVIGFSLQDTLGNVMGGLALQLDNSIAVGDWITVEGPPNPINGRVVEIRWRYTALETRAWETIIVPNSVLAKAQVHIAGRRMGEPTQWRRQITFNVDFRYPPADVIAQVEQAMRAAPIEGVGAVPPPMCLLLDFSESVARYGLRYWLTDIFADEPTDSAIRVRLYYVLKRAGIPLAIPAQALFLTEESRERRAGKDQDERERRHRALAAVDIFASLSDADRNELCESLRYAPFCRDESLTRQGADGDWLYMIVDGEVSVRVSVAGSPDSEIARLKSGDFLGEMSLLTGAPRTATVVALKPVASYRLDKDAFQGIIKRRPELAAKVAGILAKRWVELEAARENLNEEAKLRRMTVTETTLLASIRDFFDLSGG